MIFVPPAFADWLLCNRTPNDVYAAIAFDNAQGYVSADWYGIRAKMTLPEGTQLPLKKGYRPIAPTGCDYLRRGIPKPERQALCRPDTYADREMG